MAEYSHLPLIIPNTAVRRRFKPAVGTPERPNRLTVSLPGEKLMATIVGVASEDDVVVELSSMPMMTGKAHNYRKGDIIPVRRGLDDLGVEDWKVVSENELNIAAAAARATLEKTRPEGRPPETVAPNNPELPPPVTNGYAVDDDVTLF